MKPLPRNMVAMGVILAVMLPFLQLTIWSLSNRWFYPDIWPQQWGLRAWEYVFTTAGSQIISALVQSLLVAAATAVLALIIGFPAGRALGLYDFKGKDTNVIVLTSEASFSPGQTVRIHLPPEKIRIFPSKE